MDKNKEILYSTPEEQIQKLKLKNLIFEDEDFAKAKLAEYGYYNIINSYKAPYMTIVNGKKEYISGTSFEQIYSLFTLDHNLRNSIMSAMLDFEEHLRAATAEVIARNWGTDHNEYLKWEHYRDRSTVKERFSLRGILGTLRQNIMSGKDPIKYYRENYDIVPPWILFKGTYFSTLINLIRLFKGAQKHELIQMMYNLDEKTSSSPIVTRFFSETLFMCLDFRNRAAHGGRIYNSEPRDTAFLLKNSDLQDYFQDLDCWNEARGVAQLLALLSCFTYLNPYSTIDSSLSEEINRHLTRYPQDKDIIESFIGIKLITKKVIWISPKTHKYHTDPNCSGMKNVMKITYDETTFDLSQFEPCKKCCKNFL